MSMTIKQAFQKLTADLSSGLRNPFFVGRILHQDFAEIADEIEGGGGGGSTVTVTQKQSTGNKIGTITVDGTGTDLYAPDPSLSISGHTLNLYKGTYIDFPSTVELPGDTVRVNPIQETGTLIAEITVNNLTSQIKAPSGSGAGIDYSTTEQDTGIKWVDGKSVYQKTIIGTSGAVNTDTSLGSIANVDSVISIYGICAADTIQQSVPNAGLYVKFQNGAVMVYPTNTGYENKTCKVTIRYTKATA